MFTAGYWFTKADFLRTFSFWNPTAVETCDSLDHVQEFCVMGRYDYHSAGQVKSIPGRILYAPMIAYSPNFLITQENDAVQTDIQFRILKNADEAESTDLIGFVCATNEAFGNGKTYSQYVTDGAVVDNLIGDIDPSDIVDTHCLLLTVRANNYGPLGGSNPTWGNNLFQFFLNPNTLASKMMPNTIVENGQDYGQAVPAASDYWERFIQGEELPINMIDPEDWDDEGIYWSNEVTSDVPDMPETLDDLVEYVEGQYVPPEPGPDPDLTARVTLLESTVSTLTDTVGALALRVTALENSVVPANLNRIYSQI